ncbi:MAG: type IX secretion system sortase PorU [Saprospiraceae bacterium]|nr:type IX secretion system sortase PorU [Saprospiraceae bacterium]MDZ4704046.1 type IX secretion system sortase PorU [Saprospiraceae bacterium]
MKQQLTTALLLCAGLFTLTGNAQTILREQFVWKIEPIVFQVGEDTYERWRFEGGSNSDERPSLPFLVRTFPVPSNGTLRVEVVSASFEPFERRPSPDDVFLGAQLNFETVVERDRNKFSGRLSFVPIIKNGDRYERLTAVQLRVVHVPSVDNLAWRGPTGTETSALSDGDIYQFTVANRGLFRLTYDFLKNSLKIANLDNIDPRTIKIYGNGAGMVPAYSQDDRQDDLVENHIQVVGEEDGKFNSGDYILIYSDGLNKWRYEATAGEFTREKHLYDTQISYFLKISAGNGLRIASQSSLGSTAYTSTSFDDYARLEEDKRNLLHEWTNQAQGSGQKWYGDKLKVSRELRYDKLFSFPNIDAATPVKIRAEMALRARASSRFTLIINSQSFQSSLANSVSSSFSGINFNLNRYANIATINTTATFTQSDFDALVSYPHPQNQDDQSEAWLDYIQLNVRRALSMNGNQMLFRDVQTTGFPDATFTLSNAGNTIAIWDITDPLRPKLQETVISGTQLSFGVATPTLREFIGFNTSAGFLTPEAVGKILNQNLHGITRADMLIIYHPDFEAAAQQLAQHRNSHSNLTVAMAPVEQVYNEFSSGARDLAAIRDFAKLIYERDENFRYLLLVGDGSFDARNVYELGGNFIPVFEREALDALSAFPTDDYYAIFYGTNRDNLVLGSLNVGLGRLPVKTPEEAQAVVSKIIQYDINPAAFGDWRNQLVFIGDDEDSNQHMGDADEIANKIKNSFPYFNINKLYLDAFPQVNTLGGNRVPALTEAINKAIFKGALVMTYLGHGGPKGWAQERILSISDITAWDNDQRTPLLVTATCTFAGFDDPAFVTAGEEVILNPKGGAMALMTTTRAVFANSNADLTEKALFRLFQPVDGHTASLGEAMRLSKNTFTGESSVVNARKFALLGDPAQQIALPEFQVATTFIDEHDVSDNQLDTLRALQRVTVKGVVTDAAGQVLPDFNGTVFPTVYDKAQNITTLGQDAGSIVRAFSLQKNVLFKGRATVLNGQFMFTFVVPKDINYQYGRGRISYYAADTDAQKDASGFYDRIVIGGTSPGALADDQGPVVEVFMNTEDFVFGGITNDKPVLLAKLQDDNGINVVGNSIGHDLDGVLDNNTQNTYLLNDFYEAELDDYTRGTVRYPLAKLAEGRHTMRVKAWDVANNSAEGYTEFIVANSEKIALEHVLNYPNPFTDRTCFQFDHNMAGQELDVLIQIYTISGRLIKSLEQTMISDGAMRLGDCIEWDGRDDYGDRLARGVYLYKVKVRSRLTANNTLNGESDFEKLVILK